MMSSGKKPAIIDVEASGFGCDSYPIEVGLVMADGRRYSKLITPYEEWQHWSEQAQAIHHINRSDLYQYGHDGAEVCGELNEFIAGATLYSDAWVYDKPWLEKLFFRARIPMTFSVSPIESIMKEAQFDYWDETKKAVVTRFELQRHRASQDALLIQQTFLETQIRASQAHCYSPK